MDHPGIDLAREYEALLQFLYLAPVGIAQTSLEGEIALINPISAQWLMPYVQDGSLSNLFTVLESLAPGLRQQTVDFDGPYGMICDGLQLPLAGPAGSSHVDRTLSLSLLKLDDARLMAVMSDVTAPKPPPVSPAEPSTDDAYESLMQFLYRSPVGLVQATIDGGIEMINPASAALLMPLSSDGSLDNLFDALACVAPQLRQLVDDFEPPTGVVCDSMRALVDVCTVGAHNGQHLSISVLKVGPTRLMAVLNDVSNEVRREQAGLSRRLDAASKIDGLTQMPNRSALLDHINGALANKRSGSGSEFAILFINCDRFKRINDSLGHAVGDEVLGLIAGRLRSTLRLGDPVGRHADTDPVAGRLSGDEFVVVLRNLHGADDVHVIAHRLLDVLNQPYGVDRQQIHCSVSIGVLLRDHATGDADAVLQDASIAMDEAKRAGGSRYAVFEPTMQKRAVRRAALESGLRRALVQDELFVVYQPVVGLQQPQGFDRSAGVEALVRWRDPERGVIPPIDFIGVAEECGLIGAVGEFVLRSACTQFVAWQAALGPQAPRLLAVNLSRAQLIDPGFLDSVRRILESTGMNAARLQLEVTESLAAQDETIQCRLTELKALGLTLALDDFGTGYSSLASLHQLPVDTVKIDRSFVSQSHASHHHRVLIEATIRVAGSLDMGTVAEGIETAEQWQVVRDLGCAKGQGYLFGRPMLSEELARWVTSTMPMPQLMPTPTPTPTLMA